MLNQIRARSERLSPKSGQVNFILRHLVLSMGVVRSEMVLSRCFLHSLQLVMIITEQIQTLSNNACRQYGVYLRVVN